MQIIQVVSGPGSGSGTLKIRTWIWIWNKSFRIHNTGQDSQEAVGVIVIKKYSIKQKNREVNSDRKVPLCKTEQLVRLNQGTYVAAEVRWKNLALLLFSVFHSTVFFPRHFVIRLTKNSTFRDTVKKTARLDFPYGGGGGCRPWRNKFKWSGPRH